MGKVQAKKFGEMKKNGYKKTKDYYCEKMGKVQAKKFGEMKKMLKLTDIRIKKEERAKKRRRRKKGPKDGTEGEEGGSSRMKIQSLPQSRSSMFFTYNTNLGPPFHVLVDTNFINFSIQNKLDIWQTIMDCLYAKCIPYISDCVMAEIEKLGPKFKVALRIANDCITQRVTQHKCYIVATCDKDLRRRIRKIPGVPIMYHAESHAAQVLHRRDMR